MGRGAGWRAASAALLLQARTQRIEHLHRDVDAAAHALRHGAEVFELRQCAVQVLQRRGRLAEGEHNGHGPDAQAVLGPEAFEEADRGTLEVGKMADISAFSVDLMEAEPAAIPTASAVLTVSGGRITHTAIS